MDSNYFSRHIDNRTTKDGFGRLRWTPIHRIEVRLTSGDVFRHDFDFDGDDTNYVNAVIEGMREGKVHERSLEEMIAHDCWDRQRSTLWIDSNHSGSFGGGWYSYTIG